MTDDSSLPSALATDLSSAHGALAPAATARLSPTPRKTLEPLSATSEREGLERLHGRLCEVRSWLSDDLGELERDLAELVGAAVGAPDRARKAAAHLLERPGKRIRPLCVLLGAHLCELPIDGRLRAAALACELVHAATLLHDDVIDEGTERRGASAARVVYGNSASILAGDYLLVEALERVSGYAGADASEAQRQMELMRSLLDTIAQMVSAEALQLEQRGRFQPDLDIYMRIIDGKTASLFRWALSAAPILAGVDGARRAALAHAGTALGLAFQLIDDALDLEGDAALIGKDLFADLLQGKLTHPLIVAASDDHDLAEEVRRLAAEHDDGDGCDPARAAAVVARVRKSGALDGTRALAETKRLEALSALAELPESPARRALAVVVEGAVARRK
jgi:octaprenyl-diphosphate synthase